MRQWILALALVAAPTQAFDWPWQSPKHTDYSYCKGFIYAGLAAFPVEGLSRTKLWLSWNNVTNTEIAKGGLSEEKIASGKSQFASLLEAKDTATLVDKTNGDCDFADG